MPSFFDTVIITTVIIPKRKAVRDHFTQTAFLLSINRNIRYIMSKRRIH